MNSSRKLTLTPALPKASPDLSALAPRHFHGWRGFSSDLISARALFLEQFSYRAVLGSTFPPVLPNVTTHPALSLRIIKKIRINEPFVVGMCVAKGVWPQRLTRIQVSGDFKKCQPHLRRQPVESPTASRRDSPLFKCW